MNIPVPPDGFTTIPGFALYSLNLEGTLILSHSEAIIPLYHDAEGYLQTQMLTDHGRVVNRKHYRLMALTFLPQPPSEKRLVVNHINGVKDDDRLENLEWTTDKGNHWSNGISKHPKVRGPIIERNIDTGEEITHSNARQAARTNKMSVEAMLWRCASEGSRVFPERKQYKTVASNAEWAKIDPTATIEHGRSRRVVVKWLPDGITKTFESARKAARAIKCAESAISNWLTKCSGYPVLPGLVQIKFESDPNDFPEVKNPWVELMKFTKDRCVFTTKESDNETIIFESANACAKAMGISRTNIQYKLQSHGHTVFKDGYRYGFYPEDCLGSAYSATGE